MFVTEAYAQSAPTVGETHTETPAVGQPQPEATHTETGVAHGAEHGASGVFPPFDQSTYASQVLWLAITFGLFYLLMQKVIVPRVGGILENRHGRIAQDLDEAARLKSEADAAVETYEKELAAARAKASSIGSAARDAAKAKADADRVAIEAGLAEKLACRRRKAHCGYQGSGIRGCRRHCRGNCDRNRRPAGWRQGQGCRRQGRHCSRFDCEGSLIWRLMHHFSLLSVLSFSSS